MSDIQWKHVKEFQLGWQAAGQSSILFLKFDDGSTAGLEPKSIQELAALGDLLRSGKNVQYSPDTHDFRLAWESTRAS